MADFNGKSVIVTGASRGIGLTIAQAFAQAGANVAICATREDALAQAQRMYEIKNASTLTIIAPAVDISGAESCKANSQSKK